jgi:hypothetical protein
VVVALTLRENHVELKQPALPDRLLFTRNAAAPLHQIQTTVGRLGRLRKEPERVVFAPLLAARGPGASVRVPFV